jgi:hypothetical protein
LDEVSGTHDAFKDLSSACEQYIGVIKKAEKVFDSSEVQAALSQALTAIIEALGRISRHYEQTLISKHFR